MRLAPRELHAGRRGRSEEAEPPTWSNLSVTVCAALPPWLLWHSSAVTIPGGGGRKGLKAVPPRGVSAMGPVPVHAGPTLPFGADSIGAREAPGCL